MRMTALIAGGPTDIAARPGFCVGESLSGTGVVAPDGEHERDIPEVIVLGQDGVDMDESDLHQSLGQLLLVGDRLRAVLAARCGLTAVESSALSHLAMSGPLTQRHLGDRVGLSTGAVTGLVDRLERHGVCRREPHPTDRRSSYVTLTPHGHDVLGEATSELVGAAGAVSRHRRDALAEDLQAISVAMSERITARRHQRPSAVSSQQVAAS